MRLLPGLQPVFDALSRMGSPPEGLSSAETRAWMHEQIDEHFTALMADRAPVASEIDHRVPVDGGAITVRTYTPDLPGPLPCYLYLHGGGFWLGTLDQSNRTCRGIATDAECVVVSVDYRLAPEHTFPTAPEDCWAALRWVVDHADELGVDPSRMAVGGGSAGGNLAAVLALMSRDRGGPALVLQVLELAVVDFTTPANAHYIGLYLGDASEATHPYASPLFAPDLTGLPPAVVTCAEHDRLRAEDLSYAARLAEAFVPVEVRCWEGQFHGSTQLAAVIPDEAAAYHQQIVGALRRAFVTT